MTYKAIKGLKDNLYKAIIVLTHKRDCDETTIDLRPQLITYLQLLIEVNPMSMSIHKKISKKNNSKIFYLRSYINSHNSIILLAHSNTNLD
jgi:hypothetical protein